MIGARTAPDLVIQNAPLPIGPACLYIAGAGQRNIVLRGSLQMRALVRDVRHLERHAMSDLMLHIEIPGLCVGSGIVRAASGYVRRRVDVYQWLAQEVVRQVTAGRRR